MMHITAVFVQDVHWWIDSIWVSENSAKQRAATLRNVLESCGNDKSVRVWTRQLSIEDAIAGQAKPQKDQRAIK